MKTIIRHYKKIIDKINREQSINDERWMSIDTQIKQDNDQGIYIQSNN